MAYKVIILYQLYMPSYFLGTFTEYPSCIPDLSDSGSSGRNRVYFTGIHTRRRTDQADE